MTEFYKVTGEKMRRYQKIRNVLLTVIVTLALQCTFEVCLGGYVDSNLVNGLNKLCGAFTVLDYTDLLTAAAVFVMLKEVKKREAKTDVATLVLSVILSFLLIVCISFKKYDSAIFLWGNSFQILLSTFCVLGVAVLLYLVLRLVYFGLEHVELPAEQGKKHLQMVGFFVIAFSWLFWILLNYPGTTSGDGLVQLKQFLGEQDWGAAHPPFSSAIMGICFVLGRTIADANFGFFLYCLLQTLVGAYAFSLSMKKLQELGISWKNPELVSEAVSLGKKGNIVARYKAEKDLQNKGKNYPVVLDFDKAAIRQAVTERCSKFNVEAIDAHLTRVDGSFQIEDGQTGYVVDENASVTAIYDYLTGSWVRGEDGSVALVMAVDEPKGKTEELAKVKDVLGTFTTSYSTSGASRSKNVANGCSLINGTTLYPGDTFSTYNTVKPFSTENGYEMAGSYLNGKVVDSIGGGICQVSTTLYNAVLRAELEVTERHNHSMIVTYVDPSADAAIAESSGKDFVFVNNTDYPIYIDGHTADKKITFTIYGVETRAKNRTVAYESEVIEKKVPEADQIIADASQPIGVISVSSAHIGYKARLWKIVKENGVEVSREQVNSSNYKMSPRTATVGIASPDPNATSQMQAAIATSSIDTVKATISNIKAQQAAAAALTPEQLQAIAEAQAQAAQAQQDAAAGN